ncbi:MAG: YceI family protein [Pseudomonadota bacterium]
MRPARLLPTAALCVAVWAGGIPVRDASTGAQAAEWVVDAAASRVAFTYTFYGSTLEGSFSRFGGRGSFEPDAAEKATLTLWVETGSIALGSRIRELLATSAEGFDSRNHPRASFTMRALEPLGGERYRARGIAEVKGRRHPLVAEGGLRFEDGIARAEGSLRLDRLRFGVGVGPFASLLDIGRWVTVSYSLVARPAGGGVKQHVGRDPEP